MTAILIKRGNRQRNEPTGGMSLETKAEIKLMLSEEKSTTSCQETLTRWDEAWD